MPYRVLLTRLISWRDSKAWRVNDDRNEQMISAHIPMLSYKYNRVEISERFGPANAGYGNHWTSQVPTGGVWGQRCSE